MLTRYEREGWERALRNRLMAAELSSWCAHPEYAPAGIDTPDGFLVAAEDSADAQMARWEAKEHGDRR